MQHIHRAILNIVTMVMLGIFCAGCFTQRAAEGLAGGEASANLMSPVAGSFRVGITDHIEARTVVVVPTNGSSHQPYPLTLDIYLHTHHDTTQFNYGMATGVYTTDTDLRKMWFGSITGGFRHSDRWSTYASILVPSIVKQGYFAIGEQISFGDANESRFVLTPEVVVMFDHKPADMFYSGPVWLTLNFGYTFAKRTP